VKNVIDKVSFAQRNGVESASNHIPSSHPEQKEYFSSTYKKMENLQDLHLDPVFVTYFSDGQSKLIKDFAVALETRYPFRQQFFYIPRLSTWDYWKTLNHIMQEYFDNAYEDVNNMLREPKSYRDMTFVLTKTLSTLVRNGVLSPIDMMLHRGISVS
jgi:hypothetical protein